MTDKKSKDLGSDKKTTKKFRKRRPKDELRSMSDVLQGLFEGARSPLAGGFKRFQLEYEWPQVVGASLASDTLPVGYFKGTLYVWVSHPTLMHQMGFLKDEIKVKINRHLKMEYVKKIVFTLDRKAAGPKEGEESNSGYKKGYNKSYKKPYDKR